MQALASLPIRLLRRDRGAADLVASTPAGRAARTNGPGCAAVERATATWSSIQPKPGPLPTHDRRLASVLPIEQPTRWAAVPYLHPYRHSPLVMLVWGVAGEALREIITGFLDEVRFE